ncbi:fractalkine [Oxyura jamaicensis]|uniref:fractalkine n=1 Tax=Oxyura jamaicensis TaxID=8884 RepID=UPI0015A6A9C8|nr:fractalkine [Oxyura jamaicensis]
MSCSSCIAPEDAVGSQEQKLLPLRTLPAADHGNMKVVSFQILFVLRVLCLVTPAGGQPKAPLKCSKVCNRFTSIIPEKRIKSYYKTDPRCAKQAIIFITRASLEMCADPDAKWVKDIVWKLDQKKASAALPLPHAATSAAVPEKPGIFHKRIGLTVTAPSQATAATTLFQGTGTTILERTHAPAAMTEVTSKSTPAMQSTTQFSAGSSPVIWEIATHSEVSSEANRDSLKSAHSTTSAAGMVSSQPILYPTALVHGFDSTVGFTEEPVGYSASATADVQDTSSPSSNSDPVPITKGLDHAALSTDESLVPTSARANTSDTASRSLNSDLPSILNSMEIGSAPATPVPPETTSVSTVNPTTAIDKGPPVHTNKIFSSSADAVGTRTFDYSSPLGKQDLPDALVFTSQTFSGQARAQVTTKRPHDPPSLSFLPRSQAHFIIPVSLVGGLIACSVAAVWLYTKFGVRTETMSREMVQGLLYQKEGHQNNVYPMEII